jgi:hypothetical protein
VRDVTAAGPGKVSTLPPDESDGQAKRDAAWRSYRDRLGEAWRGPGPSMVGAGPGWVGPGS